MSRPTQDDYMMSLARAAASRTTCIRRAVGCVLTDSRGRVLSIGYNGVASGMPHCNDTAECNLASVPKLPGPEHWQDLGKFYLSKVYELYPELEASVPKSTIDVASVRLRPSTIKGHVGLSADRFPNVCAGHDLPPGQDSCEAVHAEQNAILQCARPDDVATVYVTTSPCRACTKLLMNTMATRVVFGEEFDAAAGQLFAGSRSGRRWEAYREGSGG